MPLAYPLHGLSHENEQVWRDSGYVGFMRRGFISNPLRGGRRGRGCWRWSIGWRKRWIFRRSRWGHVGVGHVRWQLGQWIDGVFWRRLQLQRFQFDRRANIKRHGDQRRYDDWKHDGHGCKRVRRHDGGIEHFHRHDRWYRDLKRLG